MHSAIYVRNRQSWRHSSKSFTKILKRMGLTTDPWITPLFTGSELEFYYLKFSFFFSEKHFILLKFILLTLKPILRFSIHLVETGQYFPFRRTSEIHNTWSSLIPWNQLPEIFNSDPWDSNLIMIVSPKSYTPNRAHGGRCIAFSNQIIDKSVFLKSNLCF